MKNLTLSLLAVLIAIGLSGTSAKAKSADMDTILIELGQNSKIILVVKDQKDLETIKNYDINKMLKDLKLSIDSSSSDVNYLQITDESGTRYLQDTTIVWSNNEYPRHKAEINIGNKKLEVAADDWDDIEDEFDNDDLEVKKYEYVEDRRYRTKHSFNVELGMSNWLEDGKFPNDNNQPYAVRPWGSWFVGLSSINKSQVGGPLFVEWGFSLNWYNWKFDDDRTTLDKTPEGLSFGTIDPNLDPVKSKLSATYLNASFVPLLDFAKGTRKVKSFERGSLKYTSYKKRGIRIGAGVYGGYRLGSSTKVKTESSKDKERGSYYMNNFRYGVRAQFGYKGLDFFANYDLNDVFVSGKGPSLNAISFGIIL
jgi:uncharacterized protein YxeA